MGEGSILIAYIIYNLFKSTVSLFQSPLPMGIACIYAYRHEIICGNPACQQHYLKANCAHIICQQKGINFHRNIYVGMNSTIHKIYIRLLFNFSFILERTWHTPL